MAAPHTVPRALDPHAARLLQLVREAGYPPFEALTPEQARKAYRASSPLVQAPGPELPHVHDTVIDGPGGPLRLRTYHGVPVQPGQPGPGVLYLHGGGWTIGDLDTHDALCRQLAGRAGVVVVAVDYRLAPEHPFPAALDDAACALRWMHAKAGQMGIDHRAIGVAGDSAGGNLAAALALMSRDGSTPPVACQALLYPVLDLTAASPSYRRITADALLVDRTMHWFIDQYTPRVADRSDWRASPLLAPDLRGVAPAFVLTVAHDPLCDEGRDYAGRLDEAGVRVAALHLNDQFHGVLSHGRFVASAGLFTGFVGEYLAHELRRAMTPPATGQQA